MNEKVDLSSENQNSLVPSTEMANSKSDIERLKKKQSLKVYTYEGSQWCNGCHQFKEKVMFFGENEKDAKETMSLCEDCMAELYNN